MGRDKEHGRFIALGGQFIPQIDPGHTGQLDVEHEAIKSWLPCIRAELFGGAISHRLHPRRTQQSRDRAAKTLIIVDDTNTEIAHAANRHGDKTTEQTALALLPFREADSCQGASRPISSHNQS